MKKPILIEYIVKLKEIGDQLSEALEVYESDPVISAYLRELHQRSLPLWITPHDGQWNTANIRGDWDVLIGELQVAELVDQIPAGAEVYTDVVEHE